MKLLRDYLTAVGTYLRGRQRRDILRELEENLRSEIEEREAELGRPMTEPELKALLLAHGDPLELAGRYGGGQGTLTFGRQLIGPEFFPIYVRVLFANWIISVVIHSGIALSRVDAGEPRPFFLAVVAQFVIVTGIFCVVDFIKRRSGGVPPSLGDHGAMFPPVYLRTVPRWQSLSGFVTWVLMSVWWALIPSYPWLIIGYAARYVALSPAWDSFYWPVLLLFIAGVAQRAANYARPDWNWLPPVARVTINLILLALIYPMSRAYPYFIGAATAVPGGGEQVARQLNTAMWWSLTSGFSFFFLSQVALNGVLCLQHMRFLQRQREEHSS